MIWVGELFIRNCGKLWYEGEGIIGLNSWAVINAGV